MQYRFSNFSGYNRYIPDAYFSCLPAGLLFVNLPFFLLQLPRVQNLLVARQGVITKCLAGQIFKASPHLNGLLRMTSQKGVLAAQGLFEDAGGGHREIQRDGIRLAVERPLRVELDVRERIVA